MHDVYLLLSHICHLSSDFLLDPCVSNLNLHSVLLFNILFHFFTNLKYFLTWFTLHIFFFCYFTFSIWWIQFLIWDSFGYEFKIIFSRHYCFSSVTQTFIPYALISMLSQGIFYIILWVLLCLEHNMLFHLYIHDNLKNFLLDMVSIFTWLCLAAIVSMILILLNFIKLLLHYVVQDEYEHLKINMYSLVLLVVFNPTALWPFDYSVSSFIFMSCHQGEYSIWACWCMPGLASFMLMWPNFASIKYLHNTWMQESLKYIFLISERCGKAHCDCCFP